MTLDEIKVALEATENGSDLYEGIVEAVNSEKEKGIFEKSKVNKEAQSMRKFKKAFEALGYSDDEDLEKFTTDLATKKNQPDNKEKENLSLKLLEKKIQDITSELVNERNKTKQSKISTKLTESLQNKVYGHNYLIRTLIADGKVDLVDDSIVFKNGEDVLSYEDGLNQLLEQNKDIVKTVQNPGTGAKNNGGERSTDVESIIKSKDPTLIKENFKKIAEELGLKV